MSYGLPYYQLASKWMATDAPIVAALLRTADAPVSLREIDRMIGLGARLFAYAVDATSTAEKPPDGVFVGPAAEVADLLEASVQWDGPRGALVDALIRAGVVERLEMGLRVRGTERYRRTWEKNARRNTRKAKTGAQPAGTGADGAGNRQKPAGTGRETETETETETDKSQRQHLAGASGDPPGTAIGGKGGQPPPTAEISRPEPTSGTTGPVLELSATPQKRPRKASAQEAFVSWAAGRSGRVEKLGQAVWVHVADGLKEYGAERLRAAYDVFLADKWARGLDPPCPMRAFAAPTKLAEYVSAADRRGPTRTAQERSLCESCGGERQQEGLIWGHALCDSCWGPALAEIHAAAAGASYGEPEVVAWIQRKQAQLGAA